MKLHELKIKYEYLKEVAAGRKTFELRKNDRDYQVGDLIKFNCIDSTKIIKKPACYTLTSDEYIRDDLLYKITYVLKDVPQYGLDADYCILAIKRVELNEVE